MYLFILTDAMESINVNDVLDPRLNVKMILLTCFRRFHGVHILFVHLFEAYLADSDADRVKLHLQKSVTVL